MRKFYTALLLVFSPSFTLAQIVINEIMYDVSGSDTGREWVEIYNSSDGPVDVAGFKFLESSTASNHSLTVIQGTANLPSGGFAVIVSDATKFLIDWPNFSGNLLKASFSSLNNTSGNLVLKDGSLVVQDEVSYASTIGAKGDGNTLQKVNTNWVANTPTPGGVNVNSFVSQTENSTSTSQTASSSQSSSSNTSAPSSAHSSPAPLSPKSEEIVFEISAGRDRLTTVGTPLTFKVTPMRLKELSEQNVSYVWSFGDGAVSQGSVVSHSYRFPGEYAVVVNAQVSDKQAVSRLKVLVTLPNILMNHVSGGVEIVNQTAAEINLEGWTLSSSQKAFIFPKDTLIPGNKKVIFAHEITGVISENLELRNPLDKIFASLVTKTHPVESLPNATSTPTERAVLEAKIESLKLELASLEKPLKPLAVKVEVKKVSTTTPQTEEVQTLKQENVALIFEADKKPNVINKVFAWPIKGVNWLTRLFVEE